jgi:hypothetical protein
MSAVPDGTLSRGPSGAVRGDAVQPRAEISEDSLTGRCWVSTGMGSLDSARDDRAEVGLGCGAAWASAAFQGPRQKAGSSCLASLARRNDKVF